MAYHERAGATTDLHHSFELFVADITLADLYGKTVLVAGTGMENDVVRRLNMFKATFAAGINPMLADHKFCKEVNIPLHQQNNVIANYYEDGLAFRDQSFDAIVSSRSMLWLTDEADDQALLAEVHRVLRPGGELHIFPVQERIKQSLGKLSTTDWCDIRLHKKPTKIKQRIFDELHYDDHLDEETTDTLYSAYGFSLHLQKQ